jgi:hypothetical protein
VPKKKEDFRVGLDIDAATGLLWQDGCVGPRITRGFMDLSEVEANFPNWQKANRNWAARAAIGVGVRGGPEGTRTSYFHDGRFAPFGRTWGARFAPTRRCPLAPVETPPPSCDALIPLLCPPDPDDPPGPDKTKKPPGGGDDD